MCLFLDIRPSMSELRFSFQHSTVSFNIKSANERFVFDLCIVHNEGDSSLELENLTPKDLTPDF